MGETSKCFQARKDRGEFERYLHGDGLDIGCGNDVLKVINGRVRGWDLRDGDGSRLRAVPNERFDFVYSSHCLEHIANVKAALANWVRVLKPGGCLYVTVPDYTHYEKEQWPSRRNPKHQHSFSATLTRQQVGRSNHWHIENDVRPIYVALGVEWVESRLELPCPDTNTPEQDRAKIEVSPQICIIGVKQRPAATPLEPTAGSGCPAPAV